MFVARERELKALKDVYEKKGFGMTIIYGRRRVGKSTLIKEFIKGKSAIFYTSTKVGAQRNLELFTKEALAVLDPAMSAAKFSSVESVLDIITNKMPDDKKTILVIDELPYWADKDEALLSVLQKYIDTKDFRDVDRVQKNILRGYQYDIAHYATAEEKVKAEKCYLTLGKQLLDKENHKFQYKEIESGGRAQKYYSSIEWLLRADIIHLCRLVTDIRYDLDDYARDDFFRAYTTDMSLLVAMKDFALKQHIVENTLLGNTKGGIYECAIADALYKKRYQLYFYKNETTKKELEFIIQMNGEVVPIEVKSGNSRSNSLNSIINNDFKITHAYKFIDGNIGISEKGIMTLPIYMAAFLPEYQAED